MSDSGSGIVRIDGQSWLICPFECGFRVLNDDRLGEMPRDAMDVHVEVSHGLPVRLANLQSALSPRPATPPKLWTRKRNDVA